MATSTGIEQPPSVAQMVRTRRRALRLTQERLASLAECSVSSVRNLERGLILKTSPTSARIIEVLYQEGRGERESPEEDPV